MSGEPRDQALYTQGQSVGALGGVSVDSEGQSPRSQACPVSVSTPRPSSPEFRLCTKHQTHQLVCGLLGHSFLFSHEVSLFSCLSLGGRQRNKSQRKALVLRDSKFNSRHRLPSSLLPCRWWFSGFLTPHRRLGPGVGSPFLRLLY